MNYEIIKDEKLLRDFIEWLPDTGPSEQYYLCLFARNKYCKDIAHIKSDKAQLKRFTSTKERMFDKIRQLECPIGSYKQYKEGKETIDIPQEALALYISLNPRDLWKAAFNSSIKLLNCIRDNNIHMNPHAEVMSEIQKAKSKTRYAHFDIDESDTGAPGTILYGIQQVRNQGIVNWDAVTVVRTRGGAHLLVDPRKVEKQYKNTWHVELSKMTNVDQSGDMMMPVVGCTQGNFVPHFVEQKPCILDSLLKQNNNENIPTEGLPFEGQ
jgi:hypothetical protein